MIMAVAFACLPTAVKAEEPVQEPQQAAPQQVETETDATKQTITYQWQKKKKHYICKGSDGSLCKGLMAIKNKTYDFDSHGRQQTGWQKIKGHYYYFNIANKAKGSMVTSRTVNNIRLNKKGQAVINSYAKKKLRALIYATKLVEKATVPTKSKSKQLKECYQYFLKHYAYRGSPKFMHSKTWEIDYANMTFSQKHGTCYALGAAFAFVGNAVGYPSQAISSGGHGWCMIDHKITDPSWQVSDRRHSYYQININLSGKDKRPNYKKGMRYVRKI